MFFDEKYILFLWKVYIFSIKIYPQGSRKGEIA